MTDFTQRRALHLGCGEGLCSYIGYMGGTRRDAPAGDVGNTPRPDGVSVPSGSHDSDTPALVARPARTEKAAS